MNPPALRFETRATERLPLRSGSSLAIVNNNGRVELTAWDRPEALLEIQTCSDEKEKLHRVTPQLTSGRGSYCLEIVETYLPQDTYDYRRDGPGKTFLPALTNLTLRVPRSLTIKIQSHNADLALTDLTGALDLTTFNGTLDFTLARNSNQQLTAHTFNGKLLVPEPVFRWQDERRREAIARFGQGNIAVRLDSFNGTVRVK